MQAYKVCWIWISAFSRARAYDNFGSGRGACEG